MRLTKIVCTLGPSSNTPEGIRALAEAGLGLARINFSHGSQESHKKTIDAVKQVAKEDGRCIPLILDTKGCEVRTGDVTSPIEVQKGQEVLFSFDEPKKNPDNLTVVRVSYAEFSKDVKDAECILIDNGTMRFDVMEISKDGSVRAKSRDDGSIGNRRHLNMPGANISLPAMTEKDWDDLRFGMEQDMDFIALSFIRTADEVREVRDVLDQKKSRMRIITKVETRQSVANIDEIIAESDGIMVARGDLGAEMDFEKIPAIQDMIVDKCIKAGKPVIVATHMLESMIENPMPTRAEVTDIAHAAVTRTDTTMLSGETASGKYPVLSVEAMSRTLIETEKHLSPMENTHGSFGDRSALAHAAASMAHDTGAKAIVVCTMSGFTAQALSQLRPQLPIVACTKDPGVQRHLQFLHAVTPLLIEFAEDPEETTQSALQALRESKIVTKGSKVVVITPSRAKDVQGIQVHTL